MMRKKTAAAILPKKQVLYGVEWKFPGMDKNFSRLIVAPDFDGLTKMMTAQGAEKFAAEVVTREVFA